MSVGRVGDRARRHRPPRGRCGGPAGGTAALRAPRRGAAIWCAARAGARRRPPKRRPAVAPRSPTRRSRPARRGAWDRRLEELPADWSDLLCALDLDSSALLPRAALLCAPINPARDRARIGFTFRARSGRLRRVAGDGAPVLRAPRRRGNPRPRFEVLRLLSDTDHVGTQGAVWYVGGKGAVAARVGPLLRADAEKFVRPRSGRLQGSAPPQAGIKPRDSASAEFRLANELQTTRTVARIVALCGSHWMTSVPFRSTTRQVRVPTNPTPVDVRRARAAQARVVDLSTGRARRRCSCRAGARVTFFPAGVLSEIVKPGPTVFSVEPPAPTLRGGGRRRGRGRRTRGRRRGRRPAGADLERAGHLPRVRVADERVVPVPQRDLERLLADVRDAGADVDARAAQMEVVLLDLSST